MRWQWLVLLSTVYLALDLGNPLMPGALTFGVDGSVEARQSDRPRDEGRAQLPPTPHWAPVSSSSESTLRARMPAVQSSRMTAPRRQHHARSSLFVPAPSADDRAPF